MLICESCTLLFIPSGPQKLTPYILSQLFYFNVNVSIALRHLSKFLKPLHVAYVDIKTAFDSVDREALWKTLSAACAAIPNQSDQGPAHWNEVMRPNWQELHGLVPYVFRGPTRLCSGVRRVPHCH